MSRPPDRPTVVRPRYSRFVIVVGVISFLIVATYSVWAFTGFEPGTPERDEVPATVRASPGGYRTYHFWHSGYHGGK
ncbi:MAG: hypothetical protein KIT31_23935 [Deltaproteobacteria bacterium]|nr:hypothetical protein [Deltaproteobacteria bacterium]